MNLKRNILKQTPEMNFTKRDLSLKKMKMVNGPT